MPRKPTAAEHVKGRTVNLAPTAWEALRRRAFEERTTISEQVRKAIADYLERARKGSRSNRRDGGV